MFCTVHNTLMNSWIIFNVFLHQQAMLYYIDIQMTLEEKPSATTTCPYDSQQVMHYIHKMLSLVHAASLMSYKNCMKLLDTYLSQYLATSVYTFVQKNVILGLMTEDLDLEILSCLHFNCRCIKNMSP